MPQSVKILLPLLLSLGVLGATEIARAESAESGKSGEEIMRAVYQQTRQHKNQSADIKLTILDKRGSERVRYFRSFYKIFSDRTKSLAKFYKPSSIRGTGLLNETQDGDAETEQWLYLPALRNVRKLNTSDKHKSFMGSDFTNADIAGRKVEQDRHLLLRETKEDWIVESVPKDSTDPYGRIETHIIKSVKVPRRVIFYDRQGRKLKTLENEQLRRIRGMVYIARARMENHLSGGQSRISRDRMDVDRAIDSAQVGFKGLSR